MLFLFPRVTPAVIYIEALQASKAILFQYMQSFTTLRGLNYNNHGCNPWNRDIKNISTLKGLNINAKQKSTKLERRKYKVFCGNGIRVNSYRGSFYRSFQFAYITRP